MKVDYSNLPFFQLLGYIHIENWSLQHPASRRNLVRPSTKMQSMSANTRLVIDQPRVQDITPRGLVMAFTTKVTFTQNANALFFLKS